MENRNSLCVVVFWIVTMPQSEIWANKTLTREFFLINCYTGTVNIFGAIKPKYLIFIDLLPRVRYLVEKMTLHSITPEEI